MNKNTKLVSVIIPCYNHERFIYKTVTSVLQQTYENLEILVADDCSTDNSTAVLKEIDDPRVKLFFFDKNRGTVNTLNFLIKQASGDYIATLGSDDYFAPEKLEKQVTFLEENPSYGAVFSKVEIVDENDALYTSGESMSVSVFDEDNRSRSAWLRYLYEDGNHLCHSSALVRREVQETIGLYHPAYRQLHDFDLWLRLLCKYPIYILPEKLTFYRRQNQCESVSATSNDNVIRHFNECSLIFYRLLKNMDGDLFREVFGDKLTDCPTTNENQLFSAKYKILRELEFVGCHVRASAQELFVDFVDNMEFTGEYDAEFQELLRTLYADTAKFSIQYPVGEELLYQHFPNVANYHKHLMNLLTIERDSLANQLRAMTEDRDALELRRVATEAQRNALEIGYAAIEADRNRLDAEKNRLESERNALESDRNRLESERNALENERNALESERNALTQELAEREAALTAMFNSTSWKVTKPLRLVSSYARKMIHQK